MKRYKKIFRIMALVLMLALFVTGCGKDFDASGYTQALLDLTFQGDTSRARTYMEDATENSLMRQYQQSIDNFVAANITNEIEMNETKTAQFADLVSKIFATMRYDVGKAEKTGKGSTKCRYPYSLRMYSLTSSSLFRKIPSRLPRRSKREAMREPRKR